MKPLLRLSQFARLAVVIVGSGLPAIAAVGIGADQDYKGMTLAKSQAMGEPLQPMQKEKTSVWAHGSVRDEKGQPVADAEVYAVAVFDGLRMSTAIIATRSDAQGRWRIEAHGDLGFGSPLSGDLIVLRRGHPPASLPLPPQLFADKEPQAQEMIVRLWRQARGAGAPGRQATGQSRRATPGRRAIARLLQVRQL